MIAATTCGSVATSSCITIRDMAAIVQIVITITSFGKFRRAHHHDAWLVCNIDIGMMKHHANAEGIR